MPMQHVEMPLAFVIIIVPTAFFVALFLFRRLVRLVVCRDVIQCGLRMFTEVLGIA